MGCPKSLDYRQEIGKVVSSISIADEEEEDIAFSVWIIMPAVRCSKLDQITSITERIFALTMLSRFQSVHLKAVEQRGAKQTI